MVADMEPTAPPSPGDAPAADDNALLQFLSASPTPYHAAEHAAQRLDELGFTCLDEAERWQLETGRNYYVMRAGSALLAFRIGHEAPAEGGFRVLSAHLDSPSLKLKLRGAERHGDLCRVPIEVYGGPILSTWLDRELGIGGRLMVRSASGEIHPLLVKTEEPVATIPNVAIHLNREVNKGFEYNAQDHLAALVNCGSPESTPEPGSRFPKAAGELATFLAELVGVAVDAVLGWDLSLWDTAPARPLGPGAQLYSGGRLDNLVGSWTAVEALGTSAAGRATQVLALFDAEEVGSRAGPGADSAFLEGVLSRIVTALGGDSEDYHRAMARSELVSNDAAHAMHPSYSAKYDPDYSPVLGRGPAVKLNAKLRYATSASGAARVVRGAEAAGVALQYLSTRSDMRSGSTIGPFGWARTGIDPVDIGVPILAMHSIRETGDLRDARAMVTLQQALLTDRPD